MLVWFASLTFLSQLKLFICSYISTLLFFLQSRYAAVKGSENDAELETHVKNVCNALEYFERRIAQLVTPYSNITDILKSKIVNFAKCVKRVSGFRYSSIYIFLSLKIFLNSDCQWPAFSLMVIIFLLETGFCKFL